MEKQPVIIKNNKYGLIVILDGDQEFEALQEKVAEKFRASAKFFGETQIALCFQGRKLSQEEEMALVETITGNCRLQVISIVDEDETTEQAMKKAVETQAEREGLMDLQDGRFYKGTLRSGQVLESETIIIILGDVNPGGRVISKGNVVVLGAMKGNAFVCAAGHESAFVADLSMDPMQIRIGDVIARSSDKGQAKKKKTEDVPKIAYVEDGNIYIEPITKDVLNDINL